MVGCSKERVFCSFWAPKSSKHTFFETGPQKWTAVPKNVCFAVFLGAKGAKHTFFEYIVHCWKKGRRKEAGEGGRPVSRKEGSAF